MLLLLFQIQFGKTDPEAGVFVFLGVEFDDAFELGHDLLANVQAQSRALFVRLLVLFRSAAGLPED